MARRHPSFKISRKGCHYEVRVKRERGEGGSTTTHSSYVDRYSAAKAAGELRREFGENATVRAVGAGCTRKAYRPKKRR